MAYNVTAWRQAGHFLTSSPAPQPRLFANVQIYWWWQPVIRPPEPPHSNITAGDCFNVHPRLRQTDVRRIAIKHNWHGPTLLQSCHAWIM